MAISLRSRADTDMLPTILYASLFASLFAAVAIVASHEGFDLLPSDLRYSISLGVFQVGLGFLLFTLGARHLPAVELNLLSLTEIIVGPILVWIVIGEIPINSTLIGGAVIISAIVVIAILGATQSKYLPKIQKPFS